MPQRTNEFQTLLSQIYAALHGKKAIVEESAMVFNHDSEVDTEIDILVTFELGSNKYRTAVECQDRSRRAGTSWISELKAKRDGCRLEKMIAVHSKGFTPSAKTLAIKFGIETLTPIEVGSGDSLYELINPFTGMAFQSTTCSFPEGIIFAFEPGNHPNELKPDTSYIIFPDEGTMSIKEFDKNLREVVRSIWSNTQYDLTKKCRRELEETEVSDHVYVQFEFPKGTFVRFEDSSQLSVLYGKANGEIKTKVILVDNLTYVSPKEGVLATHADFNMMGKKASVTFTNQEDRKDEMGICVTLEDGTVTGGGPMIDKRLVGNIKLAIKKL